MVVSRDVVLCAHDMVNVRYRTDKSSECLRIRQVAVEDIERSLVEESKQTRNRPRIKLGVLSDCTEINNAGTCVFEVLPERIIATEKADCAVEVLFLRPFDKVQNNSRCAIRCELVNKEADAYRFILGPVVALSIYVRVRRPSFA
ncbi:hypothetical protein C444_20636 [Haloarcula japonica DSM 6131]|uniref:Uncharacterized protein n=1 Tax=Haloarcula japonica (strain ATCC 49778 / DSM 6131 / JCM 7785 / NBRC 101032 / NCIMB 13157 / TR-1) TaxID=1227453 RepID=M0L5A6_HALJT|nr:hypothetical protein C444_20636 [Haloarcula japonica DSM 6131]